MSESFAALPVRELIRPEGYACACGRRHHSSIRVLESGSGAMKKIPEAVRALGAVKPMLVCDRNTYEAAGKAVEDILKAAGIAYTLHVIPAAEKLMPGEFGVGSIAIAMPNDCDLILGVGSGVINDLCKVAGRVSGRPNMIVGTAPSMDGYASDSSAMEVNNIKLSLPEQAPSAIICDTAVMAQAPMRMLGAGLGDMIAKYSALCEWRIDALVNGIYYCPEIAELVRASLRRIMDGADGVPQRKETSIGSIADGLVLSGIAMEYAGNSRCASGLEHYFSHCWEMMALSRGQGYDLHGIQVGVGMLLTLEIYRKLLTLTPTMERVETAIAAFDEDAWARRLRGVFGASADEFYEMERKYRKNDPEGRRARARTIIAHWDEIRAIVKEELPDPDEIRALMLRTGMPVTPKEIGISAEDTVNAFVCSRDVRNKYLISSLIWDIGYTDEFAELVRGCCEA